MRRALLAVLGASAIAAGAPPRVERLAAEPAGTRALPPAVPARQIEFVGDSHTVGYGNRSTRTACSTQ